jgi:hypothetical protein
MQTLLYVIWILFLPGARAFSFLCSIHTALRRSQLPVQWILGVVYPGLKQQEKEA